MENKKWKQNKYIPRVPKNENFMPQNCLGAPNHENNMPRN